MSILIYIILYLFFSTAGLTLMKIGSDGTNLDLFRDKIIVNLQFELIFGAVCYFISFILWLLILKNYKLNFIFPVVSGLGYMCILVASYLILKEKITLIQLIGCITIFIGIVLLSLKR